MLPSQCKVAQQSNRPLAKVGQANSVWGIENRLHWEGSAVGGKARLEATAV
ncbi:hypothetical protein [Nostoc sp.]|uniref:hypothetical protein n=1 Tax=Nostoc sp. TaxID=1180 RepID=UPI002FFC6B42